VWRAEVAAAAAYAQAIQRLQGRPEAVELRTLRDEHAEAATRLRRHVAPADDAGGSGAGHALAGTPDGHARSAAPVRVLRELQDLERSARALCERTLVAGGLDPEVQRMLAGTVLPRHDENFRRLEEMAARVR
jgi:hypothetical protein